MRQTKFQPNIPSGSGERFILLVSLFKLRWPSWTEALQSDHAACEILEAWVQWFQRISHLNGLKC